MPDGETIEKGSQVKDKDDINPAKLLNEYNTKYNLEATRLEEATLLGQTQRRLFQDEISDPEEEEKDTPKGEHLGGTESLKSMGQEEEGMCKVVTLVEGEEGDMENLKSVHQEKGGLDKVVTPGKEKAGVVVVESSKNVDQKDDGGGLNELVEDVMGLDSEEAKTKEGSSDEAKKRKHGSSTKLTPDNKKIHVNSKDKTELLKELKKIEHDVTKKELTEVKKKGSEK